MLFELKANRARLHDIEEGEPENPPRTSKEWSDHVGITEIKAAAGAGAVVLEEMIKGQVKFPYRWLRSRGLKPESYRIIRVAGESMEPTLPDGSAILVNLESEHPEDGRIFVVRTGDELIVKRTMRDDKAGWLLVSDNPDKRTWPTQPWPDDGEIVGEVKWLGRSFT